MQQAAHFRSVLVLVEDTCVEIKPISFLIYAELYRQWYFHSCAKHSLTLACIISYTLVQEGKD